MLRLVLFVVTLLALFATAAPARADNGGVAFVFRTGYGERVFIPPQNAGFNYLNVQNDVFFNPGFNPGYGFARDPFVFRNPGYGVGFAPVRGPVLFAVRPPLFSFRFTKIRR